MFTSFVNWERRPPTAKNWECLHLKLWKLRRLIIIKNKKSWECLHLIESDHNKKDEKKTEPTHHKTENSYTFSKGNWQIFLIRKSARLHCLENWDRAHYGQIKLRMFANNWWLQKNWDTLSNNQRPPTKTKLRIFTFRIKTLPNHNKISKLK